MTHELIERLQKRVSQLADGEAEGLPKYKTIAQMLAGLIENGDLLPDEKLPPIRMLAKVLQVNNSTIVNAYKHLESKHYVYSVTGSGTYVAEVKALADTTGGQQAALPDLNVYMPVYSDTTFINFANTATSAELFPVSEFKKLFNAVLDRDMGDAFGYEESQGYLPLRNALCSYMETCGIQTQPDRIQIISGAQQGLDIIAKAMLSPGDPVISESPTYYGGIASFASRGANVMSVPMLEDGIDLPKLEALVKIHKPRLVYVMPYFQTPTCFSYSMEKKRQLLVLAQKYDFYIIEEDNQSDFNYTKKNIVPLKALDYKNRVIYIKSFSKILMPGLRLGFMVLPMAVMKQVLSAKYTADKETSGFIQRAFQLFIENGQFYKHILGMRKIYEERYRMMVSASRRYIGGKLTFTPPGGGLNFWYALPDPIPPVSFCDYLLAHKVVVAPGSLFAVNNEVLPNIRLSFASTSLDDIEKGIGIIANALKEFPGS